MLIAFSSAPFYTKYVHQDSPLPPEIAENPKFFPYFADALGAIDGTHINCSPSAAEKEFARNRKGGITQNCLIACSFDLRFLYILSGWEGSAADAALFNDARTSDFHVPQGKYYLADAGFALCRELLTPYSGKRYHLKEWERAELQQVESLLSLSPS